MEVHATLNVDPRCVGEARRLTRSTLHRWGLDALTEVAGLLVSELATNAILHARSPIALTLESNQTGVRVYVCDDSPAVPRMRRFSAEAATGRGVRLLESLANAWGVQSSAQGKCVWFALVEGMARQADEWEFDVSGIDPL